MITLYGYQRSRSFRALWALEEAQLAYEYHVVDMGSHDSPLGSESPTFRAISPQGKVPVLVHHDWVLTESAAIVHYIGSLVPDQRLVVGEQEGAKAMACYHEMAYFIMTELEQPLWNKAKHTFVLPKAMRLPEMQKTTEFEFERAMRALSAEFDGSAYALSRRGIDRFTMVDILLAHSLQWADKYGFTVPEAFLIYRDRLYQREACQRAIKATE